MKSKIDLILIIGSVLIALGIGLFVKNTMDGDITPPEFIYTYPASGGVYPILDYLHANVRDVQSGVKSVIYYDKFYESGISLVWRGTNTWQFELTTLITEEGTYPFVFRAENNEGLASELRGNYTISYTDLTGEWYINDVNGAIISPSSNLTFKFLKLTGVSDTYVRTNVNILGESGKNYTFELKYSYVDFVFWQESIIVELDNYVISLRAEDINNGRGFTSTVYMTTIVPYESYLPYIFTISGAGLIIVYCIVRLKRLWK